MFCYKRSTSTEGDSQVIGGLQRLGKNYIMKKFKAFIVN